MINKKNLLLIAILIFSLSSCMNKKMYKEASDIYKTMSLKQKIGQMLMIAIPGKKMSPMLEKMIKKYSPGGIILFGYNLSKKQKLKNFIDENQSLSVKYSGIPLFVSID